MYLLRAALLLGIWILALPAFAQSAAKEIKTADKAFKRQDYYTAQKSYELALKDKKGFGKLKPAKEAEVYYRYAECCRYTYLFGKAEEYYRKVVNHPEKASFADVDFYYAYTLKHNGKYPEAAAEFYKFLQVNQGEATKKIAALKPKAEREILACGLSQILVSNPNDSIKIRSLGKNVNTEYSDFAPHEVDNELYYSSLRFERQFQGRRDPNAPKEKFLIGKIFASKDKGSRLGTLVPNLNIKYQSVGNSTLSLDGKRLYFTQCAELPSGEVRCALYMSKRKGNAWEKPVKLPAPINLEEYTSTHPSFGFDSVAGKEILFFVSNRPGGEGDLDLWRAELLAPNGLEFGAPENLGKPINTPDADATPHFHTKTQILYFSSKGHPGLGGFDLFKTDRKANGWSYPENLGVPLNSAANDLYLVINQNDTTGYFSSNRTGSQVLTGESCCNDIYALSLGSNFKEYICPCKMNKPDTPATKVDTPVVTKVDTPVVTKVDTPVVTKVDTPVVTKVDTPVVTKVDTPVVTKVDTPKVEELNALLPITLYFHNDEPDSNTMATTTKTAYSTAYERYLALIPDYVANNQGGESAIDQFFAKEVIGNYKKTQTFLDGLSLALASGEKVEVQLRGYTSPRASGNYNIALAKRRISSMQREFRTYKNGIFETYLKKGQLVVKELPLGETTAPTNVADALEDRNSIYSVGAARERRIEIVLIKRKS